MHDPREVPVESTDPPLPAPFTDDDLEATAIRARLAARMFGVEPATVRIGRYEVIGKLGAGGMGVVFSARDPELGRMVALKLLSGRRSGDPEQRRRLFEEARALARLSHPNVVQIHEIGEHDGSIFLALELVEGDTLANWQRRPGRRWSEVLAAHVDAARGLAAAHAVGVVHRDVKPSNILVGVDGRVRVVDFGLARAAAEATETSVPGSPAAKDRLSTVGGVGGTPAYMSPEQARGLRVDARSDLFSLCVSLFEGLYGVRPYEGRDLRELDVRGEVDASELRSAIPRGSPVPGWLLGVLVRGLQPSPQRRWPDMTALIDALVATPRRIRRRRILAGVVGGLALGGWGAASMVSAPSTCPEVVGAIEGVWDPPRKAAIQARFAASGLDFADTAWTQVEGTLDAAVLAWSGALRTACARTRIERVQSDEQFDLAAACLSDHARGLADLTALLAQGGPEVVTQAYALARALGDPERCNSTDVLRCGPPPPPPELRQRVDELRRELDAVRFLTISAQYAAAYARADALVDVAAVHAPLRAEALYRRGVVAARRGDLDGAARDLDGAAAEAEAAQDDRLAAAVLGELTELAIHDRRDIPTAQLFASLHGAKLERIDAEPTARADHLDRRGELAALAQDFETALAEHEAACALRPPDDLLGRARCLKGIANALAEQGRVGASIEQLLAVRDLLARELGASHPETARVEFNLALSLRARAELDDLARAEAMLRSVLAVEIRHGGETGLRAARTRIALAKVLGERGELAQANIELAGGLAVLRDRLPPSHDDLINALALAINLHDEGREWDAAADATAALIRSLRARGEPIPFDVLHNAGEFELRRRDAIAATPHFDQALALATLDDPPVPLRLLYALNGRGKLYLVQGEPARAKELFDRALALLPGVEDVTTPLRAEILWGAAQSLARTDGDPRAARRMAKDADALFRADDPAAPELTEIAEFLAPAGRRSGDRP